MVAKIDMHVHTVYSGHAFIKPEKLIKKAVKRGLAGVAVVDHDTFRGAEVTDRILRRLVKHPPNWFRDAVDYFFIIKGVEFKTDRGEIIGYFLNEDIPVRGLYEVVDRIKGQGGLVCVPHPFDRLRKASLTRVKPEDVAELLEVFNARTVYREDNEKASDYAERTGLYKTAGSDAHLYSEIGNGYVEFPGMSEYELKMAVGDPRKFLKILGNGKIRGRRSSLLVHAVTKTVKILGKK